jgi:ComF family protein
MVLCGGCRDALPRRCTLRRLRDGTRVAAAGPADAPLVARAVWHLKYRNMPALAVPLASWMADGLGRLPEAAAMVRAHPLVVPVPLHPRRQVERGYNQAELLARGLAGTALTVAADALVRKRHTAPQVGSGRAERFAHMMSAFDCARPELVLNRAVLLVDDVCTTGATLGDCARALREAGARSVAAVVLAGK